MNIRALCEQFAKFGVVGVIAFAIDFAVLVALTEFCGWHPVVSAALSFSVSVIFNYAASMRFVFKRRQDMSKLRELTVFVLLSIVGLGVNELVMWVGSILLSANYVVAKIVATAVVTIWNFFSRKRWLEAGE